MLFCVQIRSISNCRNMETTKAVNCRSSVDSSAPTILQSWVLKRPGLAHMFYKIIWKIIGSLYFSDQIFYRSCLDSDHQTERNGAKKIKEIIQKVGGWNLTQPGSEAISHNCFNKTFYQGGLNTVWTDVGIKVAQFFQNLLKNYLVTSVFIVSN